MIWKCYAPCSPVHIKHQAFTSRKANKSSLLPVPRLSCRWLAKKACESMASSTVCEIRRLQRADGPALVLAIGTANPPNHLSQEEYLEYYFRATKSEHLTDLKREFKSICDRTGTEKRFFHHTQELLDAHPRFFDGGHDRLEIAAAVAPDLAALAAAKAITKWGRPATDITHLIVSTNSCARAPGADLRIASLLGLRPSVVCTLLQINGCSAGSASLRLAKDIAENNRGARVLVVCVELSVAALRGPEENYPHTLISQAIFSDGAGAVIIGADTVHPLERPLFEMVSASQIVIPGTDHLAMIKTGEGGIYHQLSMRELVPIVAQNIEQCISDELKQLGVGVEWNDLFWAMHPGVNALLDHVDQALMLDPGKLAASRTVLREYGNMLSATVIFVLDEQRRRMEEDGEEGVWGVMLGFGHGFTIETMVMHATSNLKQKYARM
ncbi:bisdemethoxycurcumin synthase-like isoform X2 [Triticum dicoccoides]|uniref:bisdemethoxycurcumin synthase-like isoform X2 n=1 Tax=Triticum dicoccoides TaxID=85692 RepID=UPI001891B551|nr:bisdemethoxycurcumin synthase-like isoform X2 [Triticum dicoccoides]